MTIFSSSVLLDTTFSRLVFLLLLRVLAVLRLNATLIFSFIIIIIIIMIIIIIIIEWYGYTMVKSLRICLFACDTRQTEKPTDRQTDTA